MRTLFKDHLKGVLFLPGDICLVNTAKGIKAMINDATGAYYNLTKRNEVREAAKKRRR